MEPVYIIASFRRSGSSMMAKCLHDGGIKVRYNKRNDTRFNMQPYGDSTYRPNPNGFFAIEGFIDFESPLFYEENAGTALKVPRMDLPILTHGKYKLIFMTRNPKEIQASFRRFTKRRTWGLAEVSLYFYDQIKDALFDKLKARKDFEIIEVNYNDVLNDPIGQLQRIKDFGVPIDVKKAAGAVDRRLYRNKIV